MPSLLLWVLIQLGAASAWSGPRAPDLTQSYDQFFVNIMDDPAGIARWSRHLLEHPTPELTAYDKAKLVGIYGGTCYEFNCVDDPWFNEKVVRDAIPVAEGGSDKSLTLRLYLMLDYITSADKNIEVSLRGLDQLKQKAESMGGGRLLADVYREYSGVFEAYDDKPKALLYMQKALEEVKKDTFPGDLLPYMLQYDAGVLTAHMGDLDKARNYYQAPLDFCRKEKIRHYGALILANKARSFVKSDKADVKLGISMVAEAESLIQDLDEPMVRSYIALVRGEGYFRLDDFDRAVRYFKQAHELFITAKSLIWQGEAAFWVAQAEAKRQGYAEALTWLQISEKVLSENNSDRMRIEILRSSILKGLGRHQEALDSLEKSVTIREQIDKETQQGEISKLRSQMEFIVQENQNEHLKWENARKNQQLREVAAAGLVILLLLVLSIWQTKKLKSAQSTIHNILAYIEEGIITIGRGFRVEASLSPYIDQLIDRQSNAQSHEDVFHALLKKIDISEHDKQLIRDTLEACMGSTELTWELNSAHLPIEVTINQGRKILALDWRPIIGRNQTIDHFLLVLRDHSLRRQLEKQLSHEHDRLLQTTAQMQEIIRARPQRVRRVLSRILEQQPWIKQLRATDEGLELARILHTLKGDARTLGLPSLASYTHALESNPRDPELWTNWEEHIQQYQRLLENFEESSETRRPPPDNTLHELAQEILEGLKPHMEKHALLLQRFCIDDAWGATTEFDREGLRTILLHGLTNAIDHGFIIPQQTRGFARKQVELCVQASRTESTLRLSISDNGAGIERESLARKYGKNMPLSDDEVTGLILQAGVTSAPKLTETSGRGIGLNSVQSLVQTWSGTVRLASGNGDGTRLEVQWPEMKSRLLMQPAPYGFQKTHSTT